MEISLTSLGSSQTLPHLRLVEVVGPLGEMPPKHHIPEFLFQVQDERGTIRNQQQSHAMRRAGRVVEE
jgi:hypothetical protein